MISRESVLFLMTSRAECSELGRWRQELLLTTLVVQGLRSFHLLRLELMFKPFRTDSKTDCSVLGLIRVATDDLRYGFVPYMPNVLDLIPVVISHEQSMPMWDWSGMHLADRGYAKFS